jgi:hypothetical protein
VDGIPDPAATAKLLTGAAWSGAPPASAYPLKADVYAASTFTAPPPVNYLPDPAAANVSLRPLVNGAAIGLSDPNAVMRGLPLPMEKACEASPATNT